MVKIELGKVCVGKTCRYIPHNMSNQRFHWAVKKKWTDAWKTEVWGRFMENRPRMLKLPLVYAHITVCMRTIRLMDYDGAYNAVKPILDALKEKSGIGVIIDDSPKYIDLSVKQEKVSHKEEQKVIITIE